MRLMKGANIMIVRQADEKLVLPIAATADNTVWDCPE